jgi:hypothetical protein
MNRPFLNTVEPGGDIGRMPYHNGFILRGSEWHTSAGDSPLKTTGMSYVTLLQQIRLWMKTRDGGKQYHDRENDSIIESYFDISPEAALSPETTEVSLEEDG